ncbi:MAG: DUF3800 domain-containing protein [Thermoguttaceae bacterium]|jgi:hypothetical protein|nr:DUF3800 domain-containing protein [Thermoguttaceae bacterium]
MAWLLFLDESGHDHKQMPYEVRGGVALHAGEVWPFVQDLQRLEFDCFGTRLAEFQKELKGCKLLDRDRFRWAGQGGAMVPEERRRHCRAFLTKGLEKKPPSRQEFTAYGQACLEMARGMFHALRSRKAQLFAAAIPRDVARPATSEADEYLRKDQVFLFQRYFDFLEGKREHGLLVMDQVERAEDRRFVSRLERYFTRTETGRYRTIWIVPVPLFVSSDLTYPVQAADLAIYCLNWGSRVPSRGMDAPTRLEIADEFALWINQLQFRGEAYREGNVYPEYGIVYVPDPYTRR